MKPSEQILNSLIEFEDMPSKDLPPSEKIKGELNPFERALLKWLDMEKDRVNEILHEIVSTMYDGTMGDTQTINYLHEMIDEKLVD